jgi:NAD(P)-dependent dehydrogenase (short-subunit alcohol dehydrogenase family)
MPTVLITGCDSGLGRALAQQYSGDGFGVIATYRDPGNRPRRGSGRGIRHHALDVTDAASFKSLKAEIGDEPIHLLVSNAGISGQVGGLGNLNFAHVEAVLSVNLVGALRLVDAFVDNLAAARGRIVLISSRMGSIALNASGGGYAYRASKAGLNAIGRSLAIDLFPRGVTVVMVHPGWLRTEAGSPDAPFEADESAARIRDSIRRLGNHETGHFISYDGNLLPW